MNVLNLDSIKQDLIQVAHFCAVKGLVPATSGNFSARLENQEICQPQQPLYFSQEGFQIGLPMSPSPGDRWAMAGRKQAGESRHQQRLDQKTAPLATTFNL
jgi:hypothetical protein